MSIDHAPTPRQASAWLLVLALFGFVVPNGLFIYWFFVEYQGVAAVLQDKLAVAFILDAFLALGYLCVYFAHRPIGSVRWQWFAVLTIAGGLGCSLPLYYWLNARRPDR